MFRKDALEKVIAAIEVEVGKLDLEEEDVQEFTGIVERHWELTDVYTHSKANEHSVVVALACPFYASKELAKHAALLNELQPQGLRFLAQAVSLPGGIIVDRLPEGCGEALGRTANADECERLFDRWVRQVPMGKSLALNSRPPLTALGSKTPSAAVMAQEWLSALEPAVVFALRAASPREVAKIIKQFDKAAAPLLEQLFTDFRAKLVATSSDLVLDKLAEVVVRAPRPSLGLYNYLASPGPAGQEKDVTFRNRSQAISSLSNFTGAIGDFHSGDPCSARLRSAIDQGEKVFETIEAMSGIKAASIKAFNRLDLQSAFEGGYTGDFYAVASFAEAISKIPPGRMPKTKEEILMLDSFRLAFPDLDVIARHFGQTTNQFLDGALRRGWDEALSTLASSWMEEVPPAPDAKALQAVEAIRSIREMMEVVIEHAHPEERELTDAEFVSSLFSDRGLLRLAEDIRPWRLVSDQAMAIGNVIRADSLPAGCEWSPMLLKRQVMVGDYIFTELTQQSQLSNESDELLHCVRGYAARCQHTGYRIFDISRKGAGGSHRRDTDKRATLSLIIDPSCTRFSVEMCKGYQNGRIGPNLEAAMDDFLRRLREGLIESDMAGFSRDRRRSDVGARAAEADLQKHKVISEGAACLMPKACRGMTLEQFLASDYLKQQVKGSRRSVELQAPLESAFSAE